MQVAHVRFLRRSMIGIIVVVLLAVAINYLLTWRRNARIVSQVTQVLSPEMMRSADSIEYSTYENGKVRFKIRAERLLETKAGKNLLQGVEGSDRNPDGTVGNRIRSQRAEYDADHKLVDFSGDVQMEIGSDVRINTDSLHYDLNTNLGSTKDKIEFASKEARGTAQGVLYDQGRKTIELEGNLDFELTRPETRPDGSIRTEQIRARSQRGLYSRDERLLRFQGDARLDSDSASLQGDRIEARFSEDQKQLTSLTCEGNVTYQAKEASAPRTLQGDKMVFGIDAGIGSLRSIDVTGQAVFSSKASEGEENLRGASIHLDLDPAQGLPTRITSEGSVQLRMSRGEEDTSISGDNLETAFLPGTNQLQNIHVAGHAQMSVQRAQNAGQDELSAEEISLAFRQTQGQSALEELQAARSVRWISTPPKNTAGGAAQPRSLAAATLSMFYSKSGDYLESGKAAGNVVLSGLPIGEPGGAEIRKLTADAVQFVFYPVNNRLQKFLGDGHVQVLFFKPADPKTEASAQEFHTSSSMMSATFGDQDGGAQTVSQWGNFQYQDGSRTATAGRCDYNTQEETMILHESPRIADAGGTTTGDMIQYNRTKGVLTVQRHVRSVLKPVGNEQTTLFSNSPGSTAPSVITANEMQYRNDDSSARYSGNVQLLSESGQLQANVLEVFGGGERVVAEGDVRHLIPARETGAKQEIPTRQTGDKVIVDRRASLIQIQSQKLQYIKADNIVRYLGGVRLTSGDIDMSSDTLDAVLDKDGEQIEHATAKGKVDIRQGVITVMGLRADYFLTPGKFVVEGEPAEIRDPERGKSTARRLTFFTSDVRILLDYR